MRSAPHECTRNPPRRHALSLAPWLVLALVSGCATGPAREHQQIESPVLASDPQSLARELERAKALLAAGQAAEAQALFDRAAARARGDQRAEALLGAAESALARNDHYGAYERLETLLEEHRDAPVLSKAIRRLYEVGLAYLENKAKKPRLGTWVTSPAFGVKILSDLIDRFEQNYFDYALFLIGEYHFAHKAWRRAADHYLRLEQEYPESLWVQPAMVQRAECYLRLSRGYRYDDTEVRRAEKVFRTYLERFPHGSRRAQAEAGLARIADMRAHLYVDCAHYYLFNEGRPRSALVYLEAIVREAPLAPHAAPALELLTKTARKAAKRGDHNTATLAERALHELTRLRNAEAAEANEQPGAQDQAAEPPS